MLLEYVGPIGKVALMVGGAWIAVLAALQLVSAFYDLRHSRGGVPVREYHAAMREAAGVMLAGLLVAGVGVAL